MACSATRSNKCTTTIPKKHGQHVRLLRSCSGVHGRHYHYIVITGQHQQQIQDVFREKGKYKINILLDKCAFAQKKVEYLGYVVDGNDMKTKPRYKNKIQNTPTPQTLNQLRQFAGMEHHLHQFISNLQQN